MLFLGLLLLFYLDFLFFFRFLSSDVSLSSLFVCSCRPMTSCHVDDHCSHSECALWIRNTLICLKPSEPLDVETSFIAPNARIEYDTKTNNVPVPVYISIHNNPNQFSSIDSNPQLQYSIREFKMESNSDVSDGYWATLVNVYLLFILSAVKSYQRSFDHILSPLIWQSIMKLLAGQLYISTCLLVAVCWAQSPVKSGDNPCTSLTTCGQCIRVPNCVWCSTEVFVRSFCIALWLIFNFNTWFNSTFTARAQYSVLMFQISFIVTWTNWACSVSISPAVGLITELKVQ